MSFDFDAAVQAPFRMQPGLRRLAPGAAQLTPLVPGSRHQREKLAVLCAFPGLALAVEPGFDATPALEALAAHAALEHPGRFFWADGRAEARWLGVAVSRGKVEQSASGAFGLGDELARCLHGLRSEWRLPGLLALAFAEDLAIVDGVRATVPWIAACLPSHWDPAEKVGRHFAAVHAPVADNALLLRAAEPLMRMVCGPDRWERFVWNVTRHPRLHAHPVHVDPAPWAAGAFDGADPRAWFRSEHQTFLPLPAMRQAVFTIGVDCRPLTLAIDNAAKARRLHDAIASMNADVLAYRSLAPAREALLDWLDRRATALA